jgi:hexosaminidase
MKIKMTLLTILFFLPLSGLCANAEAIFILDYATEDEFGAHIIIDNPSPTEIKDWSLGFTFVRIIDSITRAKFAKQTGDYYLVTGRPEDRNIPANGSVSFSIEGKYTIKNNDDAPTGYFLTSTNSAGKTNEPIPITGKFFLPGKKFDFNKTEYTLTIQRNKTRIEGNSLASEKSYQSSLIVPLPKEIQRGNGEFTLRPDTSIYVIHGNAEIIKTAHYLADTLFPATGYKLPVKEFNELKPINNAIYLTTQGATSDLSNEGYTLNSTSQNIIIRANTDTGVFYGVQSLRQLLPPQIFSPHISKVTWKIPSVNIKDYPRFPYRGVLLDVARHFFTVEEIKRLLDLMAIHKLNVFHWHLTDDEGWRIEIKRYPELTTVGAWRGYNEALPPALGSGTKRYGGFYTQEQIRDIVNYAAARHITIVPEIDMPGHARAMMQSLPRLLIDPEDHSVYSSVRGFHDNTLSPCLPSTYTVVENILTEVAQLFPGPFIHVGQDERPSGAWEKSPACMAMMKKLGYKDADQLQNYFAKKVQQFLASKNKRMGAWEEIMEGGALDPKPVPLIYAWLGKNGDVEAAKQGYDVILSPYQFLYLSLAYNSAPEEPGDYWGGYVDTFKVYSYMPIPPSMPPTLTSKIKGVEGGIWTEYIDSQKRLDYLAFPKMAALAELAWTQASERNWKNFSERLEYFYLPRLDNYGVSYRRSAKNPLSRANTP